MASRYWMTVLGSLSATFLTLFQPLMIGVERKVFPDL